MLKWLHRSLFFVGLISLNLPAQQIIRTNTSVNTANEEPGAIRVSAEGLNILSDDAQLTIDSRQGANITAVYTIDSSNPISFASGLAFFVQFTIENAVFNPDIGFLVTVNNPNLQFIDLSNSLIDNRAVVTFRTLVPIPTGLDGTLDLELNIPQLSVINTESVSISASTIIASNGIIVDRVSSLEVDGLPNENVVTTTYQINRNLAENDIFEFVVKGATISSNSVPLLDDFLVSNGNTVSFLSFSNSAENEFPSSILRFRALQGLNALGGNRSFTLSDIAFERVVTPGMITLSARTLIPGTGISFNEVGPTAILDVRSQFALGDGSGVMNRRFNSVIDVDNLRQQFIEASDPGAVTNGGTREPESVVRDDFFVSIDSVQTDLLNTTVTSAQLSLTGEDLNFLLDANGNLEGARFDVTGLDGATVIGAGNDASNFEDNTLTVATANNPGGYVGIALLPEGVNEDSLSQLSSQRFLADLEVRYALGGTAGSVERGNIDAGAWTLNGTTFNIPFMPYGPAFNQVIAISNGGNVSGSIELMAFSDNGEQIGPLTLSNVATANTVTNISASIREALEDELGENFDANGAEFDITLIVNSSFDDVDMSANYRVNNDRVGVIVIKE